MSLDEPFRSEDGDDEGEDNKVDASTLETGYGMVDDTEFSRKFLESVVMTINGSEEVPEKNAFMYLFILQRLYLDQAPGANYEATLEDVGAELGFSRERTRQISDLVKSVLSESPEVRSHAQSLGVIEATDETDN